MDSRVGALAPPRDAAYAHGELRPLIAPRSIAIAGISSREESFGWTTLSHLREFTGAVHLVNPRHTQITARVCHPSIAALPEVPDCVVIAAGRDAVEALVLECAEAGVGACIVYAAGYAETARPERIAMQARLGEIAARSGMRIAGPNCLGIVNYVSRAVVSFAPYPAPRPLPGRWIGIASQSGAMANSLSQVVEQGSPVGLVLSAGNCCDVDVADLIAYLADEPDCGLIVSVFEGMTNARRLIDAMERAWRADKPLVIYKMATGALGAQAAVSHTGSMAGANAAYRAAFERYGVVAVNDFESLVEAAQFFLKAVAPRARGVAALNTSGGCTVMSADKAEVHGVDLPQPQPAVQAIVAAHIPDYGSARNPFDMTAQMLTEPGAFPACAEALMSDPTFGAVMMTTNWSSSKVAERSRVLGEAAARHQKMACNVWLSPWLDGPGARETQETPNIALFRSMDRCFATLAAWHRRGDRRARMDQAATRVSTAFAREAARALLLQTPAGTALGERRSKAVLAHYGIPLVPDRLVQTADDAVAAAQDFGYPVVLKVESADLPHKTEAGVVRLNLRDAPAVRAAFDEVMANAQRHAPAGRPIQVDGVLVQPMFARGLELVMGGRIDAQFGALVVVGLGGVWVEVLRDTAVDLAPVTQAQAHALLARLSAQSALEGFRGLPPVDRERLADVAVRVSEFMADQADLVAELDINPLICEGSRMAAVDALIVRAPG
ncbi:acetate--CoA ligase family protein [Hydrogenophaga sp. BPS33]|uniref:acetate--CoA ligase family protein n=1 Tax=Hydrogenophaga sp. BPS33 TaxID=2651974 RepID=UPI00131F5032|nr:acetate--CoA ligase family protein [Hydrogenophaga sp. BPS33]QHE85293.1 acetate--CoA ligase family protein [Hydrogenophaga sp. BPS33]